MRYDDDAEEGPRVMAKVPSAPLTSFRISPMAYPSHTPTEINKSK